MVNNTGKLNLRLMLDSDDLGVSKDIRGVMERIREPDSEELVYAFILDSQEVKDLAEQEMVDKKAGLSVEQCYANGFKNYLRILAGKEQMNNWGLDMNGAWYAGQDRLAKIIVEDSYKKTNYNERQI